MPGGDGNRFHRCARPVLQREEKRVQPWRLGRPGKRVRHGHAERNVSLGMSAYLHGVRDQGRGRPLVRTENRRLQAPGERLTGLVVENDSYVDLRGPARAVKPRANGDVGNTGKRLAQKRDRAEDSAEPPHVLVFEVAPVRPLVHPDRQEVFSFPHVPADVELRGHTGTLAETRIRAVHEYVECGIHSAESQHSPPSLPFRKNEEPCAIRAGGVLRRHARRINRERVVDVRVVGVTVALHLPAAWNGYPVPCGVVETRADGFRRGLRGRAVIAKPPGAVKGNHVGARR